jgi:hypothetical protein
VQKQQGKIPNSIKTVAFFSGAIFALSKQLLKAITFIAVATALIIVFYVLILAINGPLKTVDKTVLSALIVAFFSLITFLLSKFFELRQHQIITLRENKAKVYSNLSELFFALLKSIKLSSSGNDQDRVNTWDIAIDYQDFLKASRIRDLDTAEVDAHEFIRRFLLHVLPGGFMKIRYYGFLAYTKKRRQWCDIHSGKRKIPTPLIGNRSKKNRDTGQKNTSRLIRHEAFRNNTYQEKADKIPINA